MPLKCEIQKYPLLILLLIYFLIPILNINCGTEKKGPEIPGGDPDKNFVTNKYSTLMDYVVAAITELQKVFPEDGIADPIPFKNRIDSTCRALKEANGEKSNSPGMVDLMVGIIYDEWQVSFDPDQENLLSLLPHTVLKQKKGSCLGVSLLFLLIAEGLDYPLHGILLPGHFFVRYDDGKSYRNIEPNKRGYNHPYEYYRWRYTVGDNSWYTMKNLSLEEVIAVVNYNLANICMKNEKVEIAKEYYYKCLAGMPDFAEAWGNLAIIYASLGRNDSARNAFDRAYALRPKLEQLAQNRGACELSQNQFKTALLIYKEGLGVTPENRELLYGAAYTFYSLGMLDSAQIYLTRLGIPDDTLSREYKLSQLIKENQM